MSNIFISHSSEDNSFAQDLKQRLESWGHRSIFLDVDKLHGIKAGTDWEEVLYYNLRACQAVIVLCSYASMGSRWVFAEVTIAKFQGKQLFPIQIGDLKERRPFGILTLTQFFKSDVEFAPDGGPNYEGLRLGLQEAGLEDTSIWDGKRPPYPGLMAFEEADAPLFFGRNSDIQIGIEELRNLRNRGERMLLYLGASGSGKSSLVRAGLIPQLKKAIHANDWIVISPFRPINEGLGDPFENLAVVLSQAFKDYATPRTRDVIQQQLMTSQPRHGLLAVTFDLLEATKRSHATVLITIDQFEELLGNEVSPQARAFTTWLGEAMVYAQNLPRPSLIVLATMRSDFLPTFEKCGDLQPLVKTDQKLVSPIPVSSFGELIEKPAELVGLKLGKGLSQQIVAEAQTENALPLLAFTMAKLYERHGNDGRMGIKEYEELGKLAGAVSTEAQRIFENYLKTEDIQREEGEFLLRQALLKLVRLDKDGKAARRLVTWQNLPVASKRLMDEFVKGRLLTISLDEGKVTSNGVEKLVEVSHEALFTEWGLLSKWIDNSREHLLYKQKVEATAEEWHATEKPKSLLLTGERLEKAAVFVTTYGQDFPLNPIGQAFYDNSQQTNAVKVFFQKIRFFVRDNIANPLNQAVLFVAIAQAEATANVMDEALDDLYQALALVRLGGDNSKEQGQVLVKIALAARNLCDADEFLDRTFSVAGGSQIMRYFVEAAGQLSDQKIAQYFLERAIDSAKKNNEDYFTFFPVFAITRVAGQLSDKKLAQNLLEGAADNAERANSDEGIKNDLSYIVKAAGHLLDQHSAITFLERATDAAEKINYGGYKFELLRAITQVASQLAAQKSTKIFQKSTKTLLKKITEIANNINSNKFETSDTYQAYLLSAIAAIYGQLSDQKSAGILLERATGIAKNIEKESSAGMVLEAIAKATGQLSDQKFAEILLERAFEIAEIIQRGMYQSTALSALVKAAGQLSDQKFAKILLKRAIEIAKNINDDYYQYEFLIALVEVTGQLSDQKFAKILLKRVIEIAEKINSDEYQVLTLIAITAVYRQLLDQKSAETLLKRATYAAKKIKDRATLSKTLRTIAVTYGQLQDQQSAKIWLERATDAADEINENTYNIQLEVKTVALEKIVEAAGQLLDQKSTKLLLERVTKIVKTIHEERSPSQVLNAIADAAGQLDKKSAHAILEKATAAATDIINQADQRKALRAILKVQASVGTCETLLGSLPNTPAERIDFLENALIDVEDNPQWSNYFRHQALLEIIQALRQYSDAASSQKLLDRSLSLTHALSLPEFRDSVLVSLALAYSHIANWHKALQTLEPCNDEEKIEALPRILDLWVNHHNYPPPEACG